MIAWLSGASSVSVMLGFLCAWRSLHVRPVLVGDYERGAGLLLYLGLTGFGVALAIVCL